MLFPVGVGLPDAVGGLVILVLQGGKKAGGDVLFRPVAELVYQRRNHDQRGNDRRRNVLLSPFALRVVGGSRKDRARHKTSILPARIVPRSLLLDGGRSSRAAFVNDQRLTTASRRRPQTVGRRLVLQRPLEQRRGDAQRGRREQPQE